MLFPIKAITFALTNAPVHSCRYALHCQDFAAKRTGFHRVSYEYCECENVCVGVYLSLHRSP